MDENDDRSRSSSSPRVGNSEEELEVTPKNMENRRPLPRTNTYPVNSGEKYWNTPDIDQSTISR